MFPRQLPETLNCLAVWRRFHEVKRLYRELRNRYKSCQLPGQVPQPTACNYFKRFHNESIKKRKKYILDLLNFAAQYPQLYKCYNFNQFLYNSALPADILNKDSLQEDCKSHNELNMTQDINSPKVTAVFRDFTPPKGEIIGSYFDLEMESIGQSIQMIDRNFSSDGNCDENDFVYKAALEFSVAVQAEVNHDYSDAYAAYRRGINQLQKCCDSNVYKETNSIIKAKIHDYSMKAEKINNQIQLISNKLDTDSETPLIDEFERPFRDIYQYKVVSVLHEKLLIVTPLNSKSGVKYVLKCINKSIESDGFSDIHLPRNVVYMINMVCYFQNKRKLFVLLPLAPGGRLIDILRYHNQFTRSDVNIIKADKLIANEQNEVLYPDKIAGSTKSEFEKLIQNSKQLLESVTKTLENVKALEGIQSTKSSTADINLFGQAISEEKLKQWACELLVAINNLHENGIILR